MEIKSNVPKIIFPRDLNADWQLEFKSNIQNQEKSSIRLDFLGWHLTCKDIKYIKNICAKAKVNLISVESTKAESIVSASCLGIKAYLKLQEDSYPKEKLTLSNPCKESEGQNEVLFYKGTLRSGERLEANNDLLLLGDVNPGAIVLAGGNIMIWGRLMGIAHAGKNGNMNAKITALELRPVQLRISNKVARGPKEKPEEGLAEEACLVEEIIVIKPARTN